MTRERTPLRFRPSFRLSACHRLAETERGRIAKLFQSSIIPTCANPTPTTAEQSESSPSKRAARR